MKIHNQYLEGGRFGVPEYTIPDQKEICSINMNTPPPPRTDLNNMLVKMYKGERSVFIRVNVNHTDNLIILH